MKHNNPVLSGFIITLGLLFLAPVFYGLWMSFQTAEGYYSGSYGFSFKNYRVAFEELNFFRYLINSLIVSGAVTALGLLTALMAAYAFARFNFRGQNLAFSLVVATLMIPSHITLIPNYLNLAEANMLDSYAALILPAIASGFVCFFLRQYIRGIPRALDEAAFIDGASSWTVLWRVIVPIAKPAIFSMGLFLFLAEWNSYIWPLVAVGREDMYTLQIGLARIYKLAPGEGLVDWPLVMAASVITMIPVLIGFVFVERHLVRGIAMGATK